MPAITDDSGLWYPFDDGATIGSAGSESGTIVRDEEHPFGCRISLERGGSIAPWAVTCGIYFGFLHTAFASSEAEGNTKYSGMKADLEAIMAEENDEARYEKMRRFTEVY